MVFHQEAEPATELTLVGLGTVEERDSGFGGELRIGIFVCGVVMENFLDRGKAVAIFVVVYPPDEILVKCIAVRQPLHQAQLLLVW